MRNQINRVGIALAAFRPDLDAFCAQLQTIQDQTWRDWVCVISCDSPLKDLLGDERIRRFTHDERFVFVENEVRRGYLKNFETAIQATLRYGVDAIACSDQDDRWYTHKLSTLIHALERAGPLSLVHSDMDIEGAEGIQSESGWKLERRGIKNAELRHLLVRNIVSGCSMLMDVGLAELYPIIPEAALFHDHWYALMASAHGGVHPIDEPLYAYRQHGNNEVGVSPYSGRFMLKKALTFSQLITKFREGWLRSFRLAQALEEVGICLKSVDRAMFIGSWDCGLLLILQAARQFWLDPPLSRASAIRGIGKFISIFC